MPLAEPLGSTEPRLKNTDLEVPWDIIDNAQAFKDYRSVYSVIGFVLIGFPFLFFYMSIFSLVPCPRLNLCR